MNDKKGVKKYIENNNITIAKNIAEDIKNKNKNGKMFYVGGYVRDKILDPLSTDIKDIDVEVFNIKPEELKTILSKYGIVDEFGVSFGIIKIHGINIDFSMPRKEKSIGDGHKNFEVLVDPYMSIIDSARRRDFTINAILEDVLTGERFDFFNGISDIENKIIKHIDDKTFVEDELRVLRACQFAARFDFKIANETITLCKQININTLSLPKERVFGELEKALLKSDKPSIFFKYAKEIGLLKDMFSPIDKLIGLKQNPVYHPEGDVWNHTMLVIDEAAKLKNKSNYPIAFMISALCHDLGKISTTKVLDNGKIVSYNHEKDMDVVDRFLKNITNNNDLISSVKLLVKNHMRPNVLAKDNSTDKAIRKLIVDTSGKIVNIYDAILLSKADRLGRNINEINNSSLEIWWKNRLSKVIGEKTTLEPLVKGMDLISMGFVPGREFKDILDKAFKLQIDGFNKKEILRRLGLDKI